MARREKGSGSWDTVTKNDITYYRYRKKYVGMTSREEFVGRTKADVKRKIQEFEAKSMRVNQKDYRKMTLGECIDNILQTLEPTFKTNNYATLQSTNRCYIKTNPIADVQMATIQICRRNILRALLKRHELFSILFSIILYPVTSSQRILQKGLRCRISQNMQYRRKNTLSYL